MKLKKLFSILLVMIMTFAMTTTAFAIPGSKTVKASGDMSLVLKSASTSYQSSSKFRVSGLPSGATITSIEVDTGKVSANGTIAVNTLRLYNSTTRVDRVWTGAANSKFTYTTEFLDAPANDTFFLEFDGRFVAGTIQSGMLLDIASRTYSNATITVNYDY